MDNLSDEFLKLLNDCQPVDFAKFFLEFNPTKTSLHELQQVISDFNENQINTLWTRLETFCTETLLNCCNDQTEHNDNNRSVDMEKFDQGCTIFSGICSIATLTLEIEFEKVPCGLFQTVIILNEILLTLPLSHFKLKNKICNLCESWWIKELSGREQLFHNLLAYLLKRNTSEKFVKADLKRLWNLRYGFNLLDFSDENVPVINRTIKDLLEKCMVEMNFLECNEGRKLLSFILCLDEDVIMDFHAAVKAKIPFCNRKQARFYGEVYYKAWSCINGSVKEKLENNCIQDFMFHYIRAKRNIPHSPAEVLKEFLVSFHVVKQRDVNQMLFRLYEPILWRSFKVPNSTVRYNAATVLFSAFPLENREVSNEENDKCLQKQFKIIKDLLMDPSAEVRLYSIHGVCFLCNNYWEILPHDIIASFIKLLVDELRFDTSSTLVRTAVFKGLTQILNNPLSHSFLKKVLPRICNSFHDFCETVRIAVIELLLKVKTIKSIEYWSIVPVEHLFARLAIDTPPIGRRIVKLLFNSFFPYDEKKTAAVNRAIFLITNHRVASQKFYRYAQELMTVDNAVIFLLKISVCIKEYLRKELLSKKNDDDDGEDAENMDNNNYDMSDDDDDDDGEKDEDNCSGVNYFANPEVITGLIDIAVIVWAGIHPKLQQPEKKALEKKLFTAYNDTVQLCTRCCKDNSTWDSLLFLTSFLPSSNVPGLRKHCLIRVRSLPADATPETYGSYVINLCKWNSIDELMDILSQWLAAGLKVASTPRSSNRKKRLRKSVHFVEPYELQPILACSILGWMMEEVYCQKVLFDNHALILPCWQQLKSVLELIEQRLDSVTVQNTYATNEFLVKAFQIYCRMTVFFRKTPAHNSVELLNGIVIWARDVVVSKMGDLDTENDGSGVCVNVIKALLCVVSDMALISLVDETLVKNILALSKSILISKLRLIFVESIGSLCFQLIEFGLSRKDEAEVEVFMNLVADTANCIITSLADRCNENEKTEKVPESLKIIFTGIILSFSHYKALKVTSFKDIMSSILVTLLSEMAIDIDKYKTVYDKETVWSELPEFTQFFLSLFSSRIFFSTLFLGEIKRCIASGEVLEMPGPLVVATVLHAFSREKKCLKISALKSVANAAAELVKEATTKNDPENNSVATVEKNGNYLKLAEELLEDILKTQ